MRLFYVAMLLIYVDMQHNYVNAPAAAQPQADGLVLESQPDRPKSFKQEVTAPLLNARQQV